MTWKGQNLLGLILTALRDELAATGTATATATPGGTS